MDYMDPNVLCPQKGQQTLSLTIEQLSSNHHKTWLQYPSVMLLTWGNFRGYLLEIFYIYRQMSNISGTKFQI